MYDNQWKKVKDAYKLLERQKAVYPEAFEEAHIDIDEFLRAYDNIIDVLWAYDVLGREGK